MTQKALSLWAVLIAGLLSLAPAASAQQGFPDILDGIFKNGQTDRPFGGVGGTAGMVYIENIPVQVSFDSRADLLPPEATLIVTAIAPPPPNVRRASPLVMGETRLLISRLAPPLQMVIAVPSDMARDIDYARIEARIIDANGVTTHTLRQSAQFDGTDAPFLDLIAEGTADVQSYPSSQTPSTSPYGGAPNGNAPYGSTASFNVRGQAILDGQAPLMRGAHLVVRVSENTLAGGTAPNVIFEDRISIDQQQSPIAFDIDVPTGADGRLDAPEIEAWIEDWASRKTHVMRAPTPFNTQGSSATANVSLRLDSLITGSDAVADDMIYTPPSNLMRDISGEAKVNAYKGLPAGSHLVVNLVDGANIGDIIQTQRIPLDGLSGDVPFNMAVERAKLTARREVPLLSASIEDKDGKALLTNRTLVTLGDGIVTLDMQPTQVY